MNIFAEYCSTPSDINEHLEFLRDLCVDVDAQVVVELGVRTGASTVAFLDAVERTGGMVWSADINPPHVHPDVADHPRWEFVWGDDLELCDEAPDCDVLFVDTSHAYAHTLAELDSYGPKARRAIVLHDTNLEQPDGVGPQPPFPVRKAALEWLDRNPQWTWVEYVHNNGLGVMRRRDA